MTDARGHVGVRPAHLDDAASIARIQAVAMADAVAAAVGQEHRGAIAAQIDVDPIESTWRQTIQMEPARGRGVLVARDAGRVVGFAAFVTPTLPEDLDSPRTQPVVPGLPYEVPVGCGQILAFEVDRDERGHGHGSRLLSAVADLATSDGLPGLLVWIVGEDDTRVRFFQQAGFAPVGVRRRLETGYGAMTEHLWFAALSS